MLSSRIMNFWILPVTVQIAHLASDAAAAVNAAEELASIAHKFSTSGLEACAHAALGVAAAMQGELARGAGLLRKACRIWLDLGVPYEAARARVYLASALASLGDEAAARLEFDAVQAAFSRLGAVPDMQIVARSLSAAEPIFVCSRIQLASLSRPASALP